MIASITCFLKKCSPIFKQLITKCYRLWSPNEAGLDIFTGRSAASGLAGGRNVDFEVQTRLWGRYFNGPLVQSRGKVAAVRGGGGGEGEMREMGGGVTERERVKERGGEGWSPLKWSTCTFEACKNRYVSQGLAALENSKSSQSALMPIICSEKVRVCVLGWGVWWWYTRTGVNMISKERDGRMGRSCTFSRSHTRVIVTNFLASSDISHKNNMQ